MSRDFLKHMTVRAVSFDPLYGAYTEIANKQGYFMGNVRAN